MLVLKPESVFTIGHRQVVSCRVIAGEMKAIIGKSLNLYTSPTHKRSVRIAGLSTAWDTRRGLYDLLYEGPAISKSELGTESVLTDVSYERAISTAAA